MNINGFFCALALALLFSGCKMTEKMKADKERTLISLHIETNPDNSDRTAAAAIYRSRPMSVIVTVQPFLDTQFVEEAAVVDLQGGFGIQLKFDAQGRGILENYTGSYKGNRIAVNCAFPDLRWLAAPRITKRIDDGIFIFTPDATREEAERIVRGLNNAAKKAKSESFF